MPFSDIWDIGHLRASLAGAEARGSFSVLSLGRLLELAGGVLTTGACCSPAAPAGRSPPLTAATTPAGAAALPDLLAPQAAYAPGLPPGVASWDQVARLAQVYLQNRTLPDLLAAARLAASNAASLAASRSNSSSPPPILLDLPCAMFAIKAASAPALMLEATRSLRFAPAMVQLAGKVLAGMAASLQAGAAAAGQRDEAGGGAAAAPPAFNGLHLRLELDAKDWASILGGREVRGPCWRLLPAADAGP